MGIVWFDMHPSAPLPPGKRTSPSFSSHSSPSSSVSSIQQRDWQQAELISGLVLHSAVPLSLSLQRCALRTLSLPLSLLLSASLWVAALEVAVQGFQWCAAVLAQMLFKQPDLWMSQQAKSGKVSLPFFLGPLSPPPPPI